MREVQDLVAFDGSSESSASERMTVAADPRDAVIDHQCCSSDRLKCESETPWVAEVRRLSASN